MKSTGIVRNLDSLGRVVVPMEIRRTLGIREHDPLEIFVNGDKIVLRKYTPGCCLCGLVRDKLIPFYPEKMICKPCIDLIVVNEEKLIQSFNTN